MQIRLTLFDKAYEEHWKRDPGEMVGLLNASIRPPEKHAQVCTWRSYLRFLTTLCISPASNKYLAPRV